MNIQNMKVLCGRKDEEGEALPLEVEVAHTFTRVIAGREFRFCVHPDIETASRWTLSHYETGRSLGAWGDSALDPTTMATASIQAMISYHGEERLRTVIESTRPIVNGCMPCHGNGWAAVGGPCTTCQGSGDANNPGNGKHGHQ